MSKQMTLEDLVPPVELCKLIPAGEFEDGALMWFSNYHFGGWHIEKRELAVAFTDNGELYPAPTLQEIMVELPPGDTDCFCCYQGDSQWSMGACERDLYVKNGTEDSNPAAAALKVWLEMKGIK